MIKWYEVTWYSKLGAALVLFGVLPVLSFHVGKEYEKTLQINDSVVEVSNNQEVPEISITDSILKQEVVEEKIVTPISKPLEVQTKYNSKNIKPSGLDGTYTQEDALQAVYMYELYNPTSRPNPSFDLKTAVKTGEGKAWFTQIRRLTSSKTNCPPMGEKTSSSQNGIAFSANFEMNQSTGVIHVDVKCGYAILDF